MTDRAVERVVVDDSAYTDADYWRPHFEFCVDYLRLYFYNLPRKGIVVEMPMDICSNKMCSINKMTALNKSI